MKKNILSKIPICMLLAAGAAASHAQTLTWDPGLTGGSGGAGPWNLTTANWYNGSGDVQWTDTSALGTLQASFGGTAGTVSLGTSLSASNLQFTIPGYTLSGAGTLTLGEGGIDASLLSSGSTTIGTPLKIASGQQSWLVGSGSTLAANGALTRSVGGAVDFPTSGVTSTSLANGATGILGAWATVGGASGTAGDWATISGGAISTYAGYTVVSSAGNTTPSLTGSASQNWLSGDATGAHNYVSTIASTATINSLVQMGDVQVNSGVTLTLNSGGLIMRGNVSRWLLDGNATTSFLTSGASTGELFVHAPDAGSDHNWTIWPIIANNGATPLVLIKDGADMVKLGNMNTYSGGTLVNGGTLASTAGAEYGFGNAPVGIITPFGSGNITVANGATLRLGSNPGNTFGEYDYTNAITVNGGAIYEADAFHHLKGSLNVGALGCALGSTYDNKGDALNAGFAKGLFVDGLLTGAGNLTVQDSGIETVNGWDSSTVYFTSMAPASQNTYSGTVTVNAWSTMGGSYLYLIGPNALANATVSLNGDNGSSSGRFGASALLFGSGTNLDGLGYATIGALSGSGDFNLNNTLTTQSGSSLGAGVTLTVGGNNASTTYSGAMSGTGGLIKNGSGALTLSGANTYTGNTTLNGGSLLLSGGWLASANVNVAAGTTLDASALGTVTLAASQNLLSGGTFNGSISASSGNKIYANTGSGYGTNTITGDLNLASDTIAYFDLGTVHNQANDLITVAGTLTGNGGPIHIKAPSGSVNFDATADYVLFSAPNNAIAGSFAATPTWDVAPANASHYSIVQNANTVTLHYSASSGPSGLAFATPAVAVHNQSVLLKVVATNGNVGTINSVTVDTSTLEGSSTFALVNVTGTHNWTNTIVVPSDVAFGSYTLPVTVSDSASYVLNLTISVSVVAGNDVWGGNGSDANFGTVLNWTNGLAPAFSGDSLQFGGTKQLAPNLDNNYTVTGVLFDTTAGAFTIGSTGGYTLTLTNGTGVVNNSTHTQTLNVPVTLASAQSFNAAANDIVVSGVIADGSGPTGLTKTGTHALTLSGANTYTGSTVVNAGTLNVSGSGVIAASSANSVTVGGAAGNTVMNLSGSASITAGDLFVGNLAGAVGAVYQTGGSLTLSGGTGDMLAIGNWNSSFGYFDAAGGTMTINGITIGGENNPNVWPPQGSGDGILDVNGVAINNSGWIVLARGAGPNTGILNMYSGSLTYAGGGIGCNWSGNATAVGGLQTSILNIMGGSVTSLSQGVNFRTAGNTGILNLNGGLVEATSVTGSGTLNLNGGTLQAALSSTAFISLDKVYVYSGGATIDNNTYTISTTNDFLAPTGNGVHGIASFTGGAGYIAPPIVLVTNGVGDTTGTGATAIAQINPATGVVTNVLITCPGVNYTATPVFLISGGGATTPATITGTAPSANTSGGLTFIGSGLTTLGGTNTYTGNTTINAGTLELVNPVLAGVSTVSVASGATLQLDFATSITNQIAALVLNGVSQAPGVYNSTTAPTYITGTGNLLVPTPGPGTFTTPPSITKFTMNGRNIVISGANGQSGDAYYLLASTNVALPLGQWKTVATNVLGANGTFTFTGTNAVTLGRAQQFYILSSTNSNP